MRCPYCQQPTERKLEFALLSARHQMIVDAVVDAGPKGLDVGDFEKKFFKPGRSPVTLRTTISRLNRKIKPLKLTLRGGRVRIDPD